jgi:hypothetical protein
MNSRQISRRSLLGTTLALPVLSVVRAVRTMLSSNRQIGRATVVMNPQLCGG